MPLYLTRLVVGQKQTPKYVPPDDWDGMWKIYTVCSSDNKVSCETRRDINNLPEPHKSNVRKTLFKFFIRAHGGQKIELLFPKKSQCHIGHRFDFRGNEILIRRLWLAGDVRVYFIYLDEKKIIILQSLIKTKDDLTDGEKTHLKNLAERVLNSQLSGELVYL